MPSEALVFVTGKLQKYTALSITVLGRKRLRCRIFQELKEISISKWEKDTEFSMVRKHGNRDQKPGEILIALVGAPVRAEPWIQEGIQVIMTGLLLRNKRATLHRSTLYIYLKGN